MHVDIDNKNKRITIVADKDDDEDALDKFFGKHRKPSHMAHL